MATTSENRYDSDGPRDRSLRVGDKERDAVSEILRQSHAEGRLDTDEFQMRLERCLPAKTYADLDQLVIDLPRDGADVVPARQRSRWLPWPVPFILVPLAFAMFATRGHAAWLAVPLLFVFVVRPLMWRARRGGQTRGHWARGPMRPGRVP